MYFSGLQKQLEDLRRYNVKYFKWISNILLPAGILQVPQSNPKRFSFKEITGYLYRNMPAINNSRPTPSPVECMEGITT